jgi:hypothetical protein
MESIQVRDALSPLDLMKRNLCDLLYLPDAEAAEALNARMGALDAIHRIHERSYSERGIIAREFERRQLWKHLTDPETGETFPNFSAWMSCSDFLGCRRTNFESLRDMKLLQDVPEERLIDMPKSNIKTLTQLSTSVRNDPGILAAAKDMSPDEFLEKVEKEQPLQHLEARKALRFSPGRSGAKLIEQWIAYALEHDIAGSRDEALVRACEMALNDAELDEELAAMPTVEVRV